jgi:hypothetical protein
MPTLILTWILFLGIQILQDFQKVVSLKILLLADFPHLDCDLLKDLFHDIYSLCIVCLF